MADMWSVIDVENWGRNKKRFTRWAHTGHVYKLNGANFKACSSELGRKAPMSKLRIH
jgi:hypothetical protein